MKKTVDPQALAAKDGRHRHFELTHDLDADGYVISRELPDDL
jgi:hypothetical protein